MPGKAEGWARAHKGLVGLLAAGAAALGVLLFLLHPKGKQAAQSAISYIPAPFGGSTAGSASTPAQTTASQSGIVSLKGNVYGTYSGTQADAAAVIADQFGGQLSDIMSRLAFFNPQGPSGGQWYYPVNIPGYRPEDLPTWQSLIVTPQSGPAIPLKTTLSNVPQSSAVMSGVG